jgi:DNA-binding LacI/PurR family transcriptional regulator
VVVDDRHGALSAMRHLTSMGLRKIAYFGARLDSYVTQERRSGYLAGLREAGIEVRGDWMFRTGNDMIAGQSAVTQLLEQKEKVEAIFCFNDMLAVGTELELLSRGIRIPEDIMLVGFGGVFESGIVRVPITSVHQDENALATAAAELLLTRMNNPTMKLPSVERVIPTSLIVRESTLRLPASAKPASKSIASPAAKPAAKTNTKSKSSSKSSGKKKAR